MIQLIVSFVTRCLDFIFVIIEFPLRNHNYHGFVLLFCQIRATYMYEKVFELRFAWSVCVIKTPMFSGKKAKCDNIVMSKKNKRQLNNWL